jgi:hypothetical protein
MKRTMGIHFLLSAFHFKAAPCVSGLTVEAGKIAFKGKKNFAESPRRNETGQENMGRQSLAESSAGHARRKPLG